MSPRANLSAVAPSRFMWRSYKQRSLGGAACIKGRDER